MFILMPLSRGAKLVKPPYVTIGIILISTFFFLTTWPKENKYMMSHHPATTINITGKTLAKLAVEKNSPVADDTQALLKKEMKRAMFPSEFADELLTSLNKLIEDKYVMGFVDKSDIPPPPAQAFQFTPEMMLNPQLLLDMMASMGKYLYNPGWPWERKWQAVFEEYAKERKKLKASNTPLHSNFQKYGFDPLFGIWPGLFTHMFLHAGFWHLFFNMFFLWLAGAAIEERWGWPIFLLIYITGGMAAMGTQEAIHSIQGMGAVGASGAVAALMGAFLVRHTKMPINMFYLMWFLFYFKSGTFAAPAWAMLLLWVGAEFLKGVLTTGMGVQSGVAYWAHVGGFVFGCLAGLLVARFKVADTWEKEAESTKEGTDLSLAEAKRLKTEGKFNEAFSVCERLLALNPNHFELLLFTVETANELDRAAETLDLKIRALIQCVEQDKLELAQSYLEDWKETLKIDGMNDNQILSYGTVLTACQRFKEAGQVYNHLVRNRPNSPVRGKGVYMMALLLKNHLKKNDLALKWFEILLGKAFRHEWGSIATTEIANIKKKTA